MPSSCSMDTRGEQEIQLGLLLGYITGWYGDTS